MIAEGRRRAAGAWRRRFGWKPYPNVDRVPCGLCGSRVGEIVGRRVQFAMRYTTVLCGNCDLVYLTPRPDARAFARFYDGTYQGLYGVGTVDSMPTDRGTAVANFLVHNVDLAHHTGLFDIGCGGGGLLQSVARDPRLRGLGLGGCDPGWPEDAELDGAGVEIAVFASGVEDLGPQIGSYSLIVLYDVLEHLLEPRAFLEVLHERAGPSAELFISTSCLDNWREIPPAGWETYYLRLAHPYTFSSKTLAAMLACTGWQVGVQCVAAKGDQWVRATRTRRQPAAASALSGHSAEVKAMIDAYRLRAGR